MRLLLIGNYPADGQASMLRYANMLRREMLERGHDVRLVAPPVLLGRLGEVVPKLQKWLGYVDKYVLFPTVLWMKALGWERAHICDHSNAMYLPYLPKGGRSITCHDVLAIRSAEGDFPWRTISRTGRLQQSWIKKHLLQARRMVAISTETANQLKRMGAVGEISVILNPTHCEIQPPADAERAAIRERVGLGPTEPFLLHVGSNTWYKNRPGVMKIYDHLSRKPGFENLRLVLAGQRWNDEIKELCAGLRKPAIEIVGLSDRQLHALYSEADALLFPSLEEGFGWPVLEAQTCGCAVITSNREPMVEVAGKAGILIPPDRPEEAADEIARRWHELPALRLASAENLKRFDRKRILDEYEEFLFGRGVRSAGA